MKVVELFNDFFKLNINWAICGGDAIDLFVGEQTRNHKDLDVAVFWEDRKQIIEYMLQHKWRVFEPDNGRLREITNNSNDLMKEDNLWCLTPNCKSYDIKHLEHNFYDIQPLMNNQETLDFIEFLFNKKDNHYFYYKRNHQIKLQLEQAILYSKNEIPFLAPEMVLLYKSIFIRFLDKLEHQEMVNNYRHDFHVAIKKFTQNQINWLYQALKASYPNGHEWIDALEKQLNIT